MERSDILTIGCGGGGSSIVDDLLSYDGRYEAFFFNTSQDDTDSLETIKNSETDINMYYTISTTNGVGRKKDLGKQLAKRRVLNMLEIIMKYQQKVVNLTTSLGGGSGSSIVSTILKEVDKIKAENGEDAIDKVFNLILILPALNTRDIFLKNTIETWNDIFSCKCINNIIFICNNKRKDESEINKEFIELYDALFDIPVGNGKRFDTGNLSNIFLDKGCTYFYNLPSGRTGAEIAFNEAKSSSVLADMYIGSENTTFEDGELLVNCNYIGASFADTNYNPQDIFKHYNIKKEDYTGTNVDGKNIVIMSGMFPPLNYFSNIKKELEKRVNDTSDSVDFSTFVIGASQNNAPEPAPASNAKKIETTNKTRLNLFKRRG